MAAISDRLAHRFLFIIISVCVSISGFAILFVVHNNTRLQYGALFLAAMGTYTAMPIVLCWFGMNGTSLQFQNGEGSDDLLLVHYRQSVDMFNEP